MLPGFGIRPSIALIPLLPLIMTGCGNGDSLGALARQPAPDGIYFSANNGTDGAELWYSDGTTAGTTLVEDIDPAGGSSLPRDFVRVDGRVFFTATTSAEGRELWTTDGSGAQLVEDIFPGADDGVTEPLTVFEDEVYFPADDGSGEELWRSDGTSSGTEKLVDLQTASPGSQPRELTVMGNRLFFAADAGSEGNELHSTDGTASGTDQVRDINTGGSSLPSSLFVFNNILYFSATNGADGQELWRSNGSALGTTQVANINSGGDSSLPQRFHALNATQFVFQAFDESGPANGEPWISNGSSASKLDEVNTTAGTGSLPSDWVNLGGLGYFLATVGGNRDIWRTDGTTPNTLQVLATDAADLTLYNGNLYFVAPSTGDPAINALWSSNGNIVNATEVYDFSMSTTDGLQEIHGVFDNRLVLSADGGDGEELWLSDGTNAGTTQVRNIRGSGGADIRNLVIIQ